MSTEQKFYIEQTLGLGDHYHIPIDFEKQPKELGRE